MSAATGGASVVPPRCAGRAVAAARKQRPRTQGGST